MTEKCETLQKIDIYCGLVNIFQRLIIVCQSWQCRLTETGVRMKHTTKATILGLALSCALVPLAQAESSVATGGTGSLTTSAKLDFQVVIPRVLFLQVGTGPTNTLTANTTVNGIVYNVPLASVGSGTAVAATPASGDLGDGKVTAKVVSNAGDVSLTSTTTGALSSGTNTIPYSQITTATNNASLPAPVLVAAGGTSAAVSIPAVTGVVNRSAEWTYSYSNTVVVPAGTYGGVNTQNSRVTYTATTP